MASTAGRICPEGASDRCLSAVMYVIFNRYKSVGFPDTVSGVCEQPGQWQYRSQAYVTVKLKTLAEDNLALWTSDECHVLPCNRNVLFFRSDEEAEGFWFRSRFEGEDEQFIPYYD